MKTGKMVEKAYVYCVGLGGRPCGIRTHDPNIKSLLI